jgi:hypothetical protein
VTIRGFDLGHRDTVAAEHWLSGLSAAPDLACTHLVHGPRPRVVVTLAGADPAHLPDTGSVDAERAVADHAAGRAGRAVIYPGVGDLVGVLTVAELIDRSAIEWVKVLGGPPAEDGTLLDTRDFVRPQWMDGRLTLVATPAPGGRIAPFEVPNPTPCCGGAH